MKDAFQISLHKPLDEYASNVIGELFLEVLNSKARWGYSTWEFEPVVFLLNPLDITLKQDLLIATLCCGCEAKTAYKEIEGWDVPALGCRVYIHWDGDGTIVFVDDEGKWILYNMDCKEDNEWEWHYEGDWATGYWNEPVEDGSFDKGRG